MLALLMAGAPQSARASTCAMLRGSYVAFEAREALATTAKYASRADAAAESVAAVRDSSVAQVDSSSAVELDLSEVRARGRTVPDSIRIARLRAISDVRQKPRFDQPRWVMLRSLVLPGWGQIHNRAYVKALAVVGVEGWFIARLVDDERDLGGLLERVDEAQRSQDPVAYETAVAAYNDRFDASVSRRWLLGAVVAYALLDAYVDAHFVDFGVQFDRDPANAGGSGSIGARLGVRWNW